MKYARIIDNTVFEIFFPPEGLEINECFTPEIASQFEEIDESVEQGWIKNEDGSFSEPPPPDLSNRPTPPPPPEPGT